MSSSPLAVEMPRKKLLMICTKASRSVIPSGSGMSLRLVMGARYATFPALSGMAMKLLVISKSKAAQKIKNA